MPLGHLLYRCPLCGQPGTAGRGDRASCPACGGRFRRVSGSRIELEPRGGPVRVVDAAEAVRLVAALGGPETDPPGEPLEARVVASVLDDERPLRRRGRVLGWVEGTSASAPGRLVLEREAVAFEPDATDARPGPGRWPLSGVRSLQVASKSLQMRPAKYHIHMQFELVDASPYRWEALLQARVAAAWRRAGAGEVVEFQPRIVTAGEGTA